MLFLGTRACGLGLADGVRGAWLLLLLLITGACGLSLTAGADWGDFWSIELT